MPSSPGFCCTLNLAFPQELNKRLVVHVSSFLHRLRDLMHPLLAGQPDAATSFSCHRAASGLSLHVKSEVSGLPFYWDFHCCPAPVEMVSQAAESLGRLTAKHEDCFLMLGRFWVVSGRADFRVPGSACCPFRGSLSLFRPAEALAPWLVPSSEGWPSVCRSQDSREMSSLGRCPASAPHSTATLFSSGGHPERTRRHSVATEGIKAGSPPLLRGCSYRGAA